MLKLDSASLFKEIRDSEKLRDLFLSCYKEFLGRYVANHYRQDFKTVKPVLENYIASYLAFVMPQLVFEVPSATVAPIADATDTATAELMEGAINHWIRTSNYKRTLKRMARDVLLGWGVTQTSYTLADGTQLIPNTDDPAEPKAGIPTVQTIPVGDYFCDAHCGGYEKRRLEGHCFEKDLDDIKNDPRYDQAKTKNLVANSEYRDRKDNPFGKPVDQQADRDRVTLYEVWLPEYELLITLADVGAGDGVIIRQEPYRGPKTGPYNLWGVFEIPEQIYPLSVIASSYAQIDDFNIMAGAAQRDARRHKKFTVFNKLDGEDGIAVQKAKSGDVVGLKNFSNFEDVEVGGMSQQSYQILEFLRERLDRNMGYTDAQRGEASTGTATASNYAQSNSDLRIDWIRQCIVEGSEKDLVKVGWYFYYEESVVMPITITDRITGKPRSMTFMGGQFPQDFLSGFDGGSGQGKPGLYAGQADQDWVSYHLSIIPESLTKVNDPIRQKRATDELGICQQFAQMFGIGAMNWTRIIDRYGDSFNQKDLSKIIFLNGGPPDPLTMINPQQAAQFGPGLQQQMSIQGMQPMMGQMQQGPTTLPGLMQGAQSGVTAGLR